MIKYRDNRRRDLIEDFYKTLLESDMKELKATAIKGLSKFLADEEVLSRYRWFEKRETDEELLRLYERYFFEFQKEQGKLGSERKAIETSVKNKVKSAISAFKQKSNEGVSKDINKYLKFYKVANSHN